MSVITRLDRIVFYNESSGVRVSHLKLKFVAKVSDWILQMEQKLTHGAAYHLRIACNLVTGKRQQIYRKVSRDMALWMTILGLYFGASLSPTEEPLHWEEKSSFAVESSSVVEVEREPNRTLGNARCVLSQATGLHKVLVCRCTSIYEIWYRYSNPFWCRIPGLRMRIYSSDVFHCHC